MHAAPAHLEYEPCFVNFTRKELISEQQIDPVKLLDIQLRSWYTLYVRPCIQTHAAQLQYC